MRVIGLDPGLRRTGWGIIDSDGNRLRHVAHGVIVTPASASAGERLRTIFAGLDAALEEHRPDQAAVEEVFVNKNPASTLKLGQARGVAMLAPALRGIPVAEYAANRIKKALVGAGHADKRQIVHMARVLLPGVAIDALDEADALAVAICHAHHLAIGWAWLPSSERVPA
jgi:crossover junction endodeoxyribonuclease RuvC